MNSQLTDRHCIQTDAIVCCASISVASMELPRDLLDFSLLMERKGLSDWQLPREHIRATVELLYTVLAEAYAGSMEQLTNQASRAGENMRFSLALHKALREALRRSSWRVKAKYMGTLRKILRETSMPESFVATLKLEKPAVCFNRILGKRYGSETSHPAAKQRLEAWVEVVRAETPNKTVISLRAIMSFVVNQCLPPLGLQLEHWPEDARSVVRVDSALIERICGPAGTDLSRKKATWLRVFLNDILQVPYSVPGHYFSRPTRAEEDGCVSDAHRISSSDLDRLHEECRKNPRDELTFLLMITTGLRIGGVAQIQTSAVVDVVDHAYVARTQGRTKEKGGKWTSFILTERVQVLVREWLVTHRPASASPCLFPGATGGNIHTETIRVNFQKACARANLYGKEFHPHALRHTFAHLLLETGNSVDIVSKCLNHASASTTERFYLKENIQEIADRAVIPWLQRSTKREVALPAFLDALPREQQASKRQKLTESLASLALL